ncbi:hypothetical protein Nizo2776_1808 [Lactiplantibacillus plantarum]|nr:hypothetical protein Nizo2776_1808 [Lactiplantibacillus plantarum]
MHAHIPLPSTWLILFSAATLIHNLGVPTCQYLQLNDQLHHPAARLI